MISGTSFDAIDVAAARFHRDGETLWLEPLGALDVSYPPELRDAVAGVLPPKPTTIEQVCRIDTAIGHAFADAAARGIAELAGGRADLVVSHGQTVYHWVSQGRALGTLQLGQPAWIAERTGAPVLSDVRSSDIARGGQGAPLVSVLDSLLLTPQTTPRAALNLGGIANMTVIRPGGALVGYDLGPANALIDAAMSTLVGEPYDRDGATGATGTVHDKLLAALLAEPYYAEPAPKSTGKELFHWTYLAERLDRLGAPLAPADVVATVTELTARVVASECNRHGITEVVASGGGTRNPVLMGRLAALLDGHATVRTIDELGLPSDAKEAYAFALIGYLTWHGLSGAMTAVTGASTAAVLGSLTPGASALQLPAPATEPPRRLRIGQP